MSPARHVSKVYEAEIEGEMAKDAVQRFAQGMTLKDGTVCRPAKLEHVPAACGQCVRITLQEGKYHQVKRMVAAAGGVVAHLRRVRLGGLSLDPKLAPGEYRLLPGGGGCPVAGRSRKMNRLAEKIAKKI